MKSKEKCGKNEKKTWFKLQKVPHTEKNTLDTKWLKVWNRRQEESLILKDLMFEHICCWTGFNLRVEQKPPGFSTSVPPDWAQMFRVKEQLWKENQTTGSGSLDSFIHEEKWTRAN